MNLGLAPLGLAYRLFVRAERDPLARGLVVRLVQRWFAVLVAERARGGRKLFELSRRWLTRFGAYRGPRLAHALGVDPSHMGDMARIQDFEDRAFSVEGHWTARDRASATKCETACPFAEIAAAMPELCTDLVHGLETATFRAINPTYRLVPLERLLSKRDGHCEFSHRIGAHAPTPPARPAL